MSKTRKKFDKGIRLKEEDLTGTPLSIKGEVALDSNDNRLKNHDGTNTKILVDQDSTEDLTNKTVDGTSATGTNTVKADASDITYDNSGSGLTATTSQEAVDEVEARLDTAETNIGNNSTAVSDHLVDAIDAHDATAVSFDNASSGLSATEVQAAIDEVDIDVDDLNTLSGVAKNSQDLGSFTGTTIPDTLTIKPVLQALETEVETKVGAADTIALTNKTIDGTSATGTNTISIDAVDSVYDNSTSSLSATDTQAAIDEVEGRLDTVETTAGDNATNLTNHEADISTHGVTTVAGISEAQVITNKDIDGGTASNTSRITIPQDTKTNLDLLARKEGTVVYDNVGKKGYLDNGIDLVPIGSGGGGSKNYIDNGKAELNTDGWTVYKNTVVGSAPDDFGGTASGDLTFTRNTTTPLSGDADFKLSTTASDLQGEGVYYDLTLDKVDYSTMLTGIIRKDSSDLGIADGDYKYYLAFSSSSTFASDIVIVHVGGEDLHGSTNDNIIQGQSDASRQYGRLCIHRAVTTATATDIYLDELELGPRSVAKGAAMTDWKPYTPTFSGFGAATSVLAEYRRVGDSLQVRGRATAGTVSGTTAEIGLPSGLTIKSISSNLNSGNFTSRLSTSTTYVMHIISTNGENFVEVGRRDSTSVNPDIARDGDQVADTGDNFYYSFTVPIQGWSSNSIMSEDLGNIDIFVDAAGNGGTAVTGNATNIDFTEIEDSANSFNGSEFEAQESRKYHFDGSAYLTGVVNTFINVYKDTGAGYVFYRSCSQAVNDTRHKFQISDKLNKGDKIAFRLANSGTLSNDSARHYLVVTSIANPQTIRETENVVVRAHDVSSLAISTTEQDIQYATVIEDTHGAWVSGVFTAPISGYYAYNFAATQGGTSMSSGQNINLDVVFSNGASGNRDQIYGNGASINYHVRVNGLIYLDKGDTISANIQSSVSANLNGGSNNNQMSIYRIK